VHLQLGVPLLPLDFELALQITQLHLQLSQLLLLLLLQIGYNGLHLRLHILSLLLHLLLQLLLLQSQLLFAFLLVLAFLFGHRGLQDAHLFFSVFKFLHEAFDFAIKLFCSRVQLIDLII